MTIGYRIRRRREELNPTQDELAKKLGYKLLSVKNIYNSCQISILLLLLLRLSDIQKHGLSEVWKHYI